MKIARAMTYSLLFILAGLSGGKAAADPPAGPTCKPIPAKEAFSTGIKEYGRRHWKEAIPGLTDAADLCPKPSGPWSIPVLGFGEYPYLPFYFLGKAHYNSKDRLNALRQFYLSTCNGEPSRDEEHRKDISSMTDTCRNELASQSRPDKYPEFGEGFNAEKQKDWDEAAERMWNSLQVWEEDGKTTYSYGRWPESYLPRFHLALALNGIGCQREACEQVDQIRRINSQLVAEEKKALQKLLPVCAQKKQQPSQDSPICQRWHCWLQQKRATQ